MDANPISGALRFELPDAPEGGFRGRPPRRDGMKGKDKAGKHIVGKLGRDCSLFSARRSLSELRIVRRSEATVLESLLDAPDMALESGRAMKRGDRKSGV